MRVRYGLINRVQVDATVPYVHRRDREILGVGTPNVSERVINGHGIGDIEFGISGQPLIGRGWIPNILVRAHGRFPTGKNAFEIPTEVIGPGNQRGTRYLRTAPRRPWLHSLPRWKRAGTRRRRVAAQR